MKNLILILAFFLFSTIVFSQSDIFLNDIYYSDFVLYTPYDYDSFSLTDDLIDIPDLNVFYYPDIEYNYYDQRTIYIIINPLDYYEYPLLLLDNL